MRIVNYEYIRSHGLIQHQFKEFLISFEEEYPDIPCHAEINWLSKGKVISRVFRLHHSVAQFLEVKGSLEPLFHGPELAADSGFLADNMTLLESCTLKLQKKIISSTIGSTKYKLFKIIFSPSKTVVQRKEIVNLQQIHDVFIKALSMSTESAPPDLVFVLTDLQTSVH
ncbi:protein ZBED8-like [Schistocerca piceifrons]|uniref:protein ZBED8-like n=1 Tax=Schistocerca piceifrons TaxID=274613 RepID=UPI001F5E74C5|nr:protein ZBED8-like [Schistocerca piceifrons]